MVTLDLTINYGFTMYDTIWACDSVQWNNQTFTTSGDFQDTLQTIFGCDSLINIAGINPSSTSTDSIEVCDSITWNGVAHYSTNTFIDTLQSTFGCDSIVTTYVNVNQSISTSNNDGV